ncbi:MAG TPA: bifunctional phosphopantothenoylcysteine decarboxylase/phosphopantothenate--cysteine ligase CoaBC [Pyrinomonadaceae bacterium]|nr:bifunctional phosphopantothenoylcysteine decarboxylase/phosphopantothenate--cysteine ligase CoaBC [Pyrinomonadaceae bacterium]
MAQRIAQDIFKGRRIALGISGGIAAYKAIEVLRGLQKAGCTVRVAMTRRACEFVQPLTFRALSGEHVIVDDYAPDNPDPIAHITFSQTADLMVIAPATANLIAKMANGIADDFLTSTYLASTAPVLIAPAMNTTMWLHPATQRNVATLKADGVHFIQPDEGEMACGTIGPGRLSEPERIVAGALDLLRISNDNAEPDLGLEHFLITVGATREAIDPVRFLSNKSSGRMGFALASAARKRGATVTVVAGVTTSSPPTDVQIIRVNSAAEMHAAVLENIASATIFIGTAAVADYRPVKIASQKIKKTDRKISLSLEKTEDILSDVASMKRDDLLVIGFAAETENTLANARQKLRSKNLDAIVANDVSRPGTGFEAENNEVTIISRDRKAPIHVPLMAKTNVASIILDEVVRLRARVKPSRSTQLVNQRKR